MLNRVISAITTDSCCIIISSDYERVATPPDKPASGQGQSQRSLYGGRVGMRQQMGRHVPKKIILPKKNCKFARGISFL